MVRLETPAVAVVRPLPAGYDAPGADDLAAAGLVR
jgi:hypothetical protein